MSKQHGVHALHIHRLRDRIQNILLFRNLESGRAILKSFRISYTQPKQSTSTSTDYLRTIKTHYFSSKSRMCALS